MQTTGTASPLESFEKKILNRIVNALKDEFHYGNAIGETLDNIIICSEEMECYGFYVNNAPLLHISESQIKKRFLYNEVMMFSDSGDNHFGAKVYACDDVETLNAILRDLGFAIEEELTPMQCLIYRICARLEADPELLTDIPVGNNFMVFINHMGNINFDWRIKTKAQLQLPSPEYFRKQFVNQ